MVEKGGCEDGPAFRMLTFLVQPVTRKPHAPQEPEELRSLKDQRRELPESRRRPQPAGGGVDAQGSLSNGLLGDVVPSTQSSACAVPFPGELRADFRCQKPAELGTPGPLWEVWPRGGPRDLGCWAPRSSSGLPAGGVRAPRQKPKGACTPEKCCGEPGRLHPLPAPPPLSSAQARLPGIEHGTPAVRVPACRVLPSDPGACVQMLAQLPQGIPLGD
ncbi:hypothetical protein QTO34_013446 [Cnephaeus nilssonii]|uniref:Uncharacterized protein n=1 Tax=Cnephaeus nilssonii TaxID=3371016 RepID=A0AA40I813_CNENI|nr:hypothetical protein QTO34_013446 [Eptesicus nilssonii]